MTTKTTHAIFQPRALAVAVALGCVAPAQAISFNIGEVEGQFDSSLSVGANWAVRDADRDFISTALRVSISHTSPIKGNHEGIVEDHAKVFNAIKNRNPERAKQSMLALIDEALNFIEDAIAAGK